MLKFFHFIATESEFSEQSVCVCLCVCVRVCMCVCVYVLVRVRARIQKFKTSLGEGDVGNVKSTKISGS